MVQLSHPYMTTGKTIALTRQTFVGKVMSLVPELNTHPSWSQEADGPAGEDEAFADPAPAPSQPHGQHKCLPRLLSTDTQKRQPLHLCPSTTRRRCPLWPLLTGNFWGVNSGTYNPAPTLLMYHQPTTLLPQPWHAQKERSCLAQYITFIHHICIAHLLCVLCQMLATQSWLGPKPDLRTNQREHHSGFRAGFPALTLLCSLERGCCLDQALLHSPCRDSVRIKWGLSLSSLGTASAYGHCSDLLDTLISSASGWPQIPVAWRWLSRSWVLFFLLLLLFSCSVVSDSFATPWAVAHKAPLSIGFPRQDYWSGLPFPSPADLPDLGIKPVSPALAGRFFTAEPPGKSPILPFFFYQFFFFFNKLSVHVHMW